MAAALLMTACSQQDIVSINADDSGLTRGQGDMVGFHKVVLTPEGEFRPAEEGEFTFEVLVQQRNSDVVVPWISSVTDENGRITTDENGDVWIPSNAMNGNSQIFTFREYFATEEEAAQWEALGDYVLYPDPSGKNIVWEGDFLGENPFEFNDGPTIVNIPKEEPIEGYAYDAEVTLTDDAGNLRFVSKNGNAKNFCYAVLSRAALEAGEVIKLDMIKQGRQNDVGDAFVKLENGKIVVFVSENQLFEVKTGVMIYEEGEWENNGPRMGLSIDYPNGDEETISIYAKGHYYWN